MFGVWVVFCLWSGKSGVRTVDANWEDWSTFWCIFTFLFLLSLFLFSHLDVVANRWVEFSWKWGQGGTFDDRLACLLLLLSVSAHPGGAPMAIIIHLPIIIMPASER